MIRMPTSIPLISVKNHKRSLGIEECFLSEVALKMSEMKCKVIELEQ